MPGYTSKVGSARVGKEQVGAGDVDIFPSIVGSAGINTSVHFGSGGIIGAASQTLVGTAGIPSSVAFGVGGAIELQLNGNYGIPTSVKFGNSGAILQASTAGLFTMFIAGVDRTAYVSMFPLTGVNPQFASGGSTGQGVRRIWRVGGSGSSLTWCMNNATGGLPAYRPNRGDEVIVYVGTDRWFDGFITTVGETGAPGVYWSALNCTALHYGSMLDRRIVGKHYLSPNAFLPNLVFFEIVRDFLADIGMTWGGSSGDNGVNIGQPLFNWMTAANSLQEIFDMCDWNYVVDMSKTITAFPVGSGTGPAPFSFTDNSENSLYMDSLTDYSQYANSIIVRNSQDLNPIWTDTYNGNNTQVIFTTTADILQSAPVVTVNGVRQVVADFGVYTKPWDWYWLPWNIVQNPAHTPLGPGDTLTIQYPSPLSYVWRAQDAAEIAAHGKFDYLQEVQDVVDLNVGQAIAAGLLAKMKQPVINLVIVTDQSGLKPGQLLTVNRSIPPVNGTFLIEEIDSQLVDNQFFRHTIKASDATLTGYKSGPMFFQRLLTADKQPKDRTQFAIGFTLAETIQGITNPGLSTGLKNPLMLAPRQGVALKCTLAFQSTATVLTTTDIQVDILQNGVSIFPSGNANKMVYPAGSTVPQQVIIFLNNPLQVQINDVFTVNVIQADAKAKDGSIVLTVQG